MRAGKTQVALTCKPRQPLVGVSLTSVLHRQLDGVLGFLAHLENHLGSSLFYEHMIALNGFSRTRRLVRQLYVRLEGWCPQIACCPPHRVRTGCAALSLPMKDFRQIHRTLKASLGEVVAAVAGGRIARERFGRPSDGKVPGCNENHVYNLLNARCGSDR